jgi:hypothetical protein
MNPVKILVIQQLGNILLFGAFENRRSLYFSARYFFHFVLLIGIQNHNGGFDHLRLLHPLLPLHPRNCSSVQGRSSSRLASRGQVMTCTSLSCIDPESILGRLCNPQDSLWSGKFLVAPFVPQILEMSQSRNDPLRFKIDNLVHCPQRVFSFFFVVYACCAGVLPFAWSCLRSLRK